MPPRHSARRQAPLQYAEAVQKHNINRMICKGIKANKRSTEKNVTNGEIWTSGECSYLIVFG